MHIARSSELAGSLLVVSTHEDGGYVLRVNESTILVTPYGYKSNWAPGGLVRRPMKPFYYALGNLVRVFNGDNIIAVVKLLKGMGFNGFADALLPFATAYDVRRLCVVYNQDTLIVADVGNVVEVKLNGLLFNNPDQTLLSCLTENACEQSVRAFFRGVK